MTTIKIVIAIYLVGVAFWSAVLVASPIPLPERAPGVHPAMHCAAMSVAIFFVTFMWPAALAMSALDPNVRRRRE